MDQPARNPLKLLPACLAFFFALIFVFFAPTTSAKTDNQETGGAFPPQIVAENLKVNGGVVAGKDASVSFSLNNIDNRVSYDIGFVVGLQQEDKLFFILRSQEKYLLTPGEVQNVDYKFMVPAGLAGGKYKVIVEPTIVSGLQLGGAEAEVEVLGEQIGVGSISKAFLSSDALISELPSALAINSGEAINLNLSFDSSFAGKVSAVGQLSRGEGIAGEKVEFGGFGEKSVVVGENVLSFSVKEPLVSGAYFFNLQLVDEAGRIISPIQSYRWLVWGQGTYLRYVTTDKSEAVAGEIVDVELAYSPVYLEARKFGSFDLEVWVGKDSAKQNVGPDEGGSIVSVKVEHDVQNPQIRVLATKDGATLFDYSSQQETAGNPGVDAVDNFGTGGQGKSVVFGIGLLAILLSIGIFVKNKRAKSTVLSIAAMGIFVLFAMPGGAEASMRVDKSVSGNMCSSSGLSMSWSQPIQSRLYRPGDVVDMRGDVDDGGNCSLYGSGLSAHYVGSQDFSTKFLLGTGDSLWWETYTIPDTMDSVKFRNGMFRVEVDSATRDVATIPGTADIDGTMYVKFGPRAVDAGTMNSTLPVCSNSNYNATFRFTARRLASHYRVEWATDSGFTSNFGSATFVSLMDPAPIFPVGAPAEPSLNQVHSTTTSPFVPGNSYYWRLIAYNSNVGSEITTVASSPFGPVAGCPISPANGSVISAPSCVKNDSATRYIFTTTYSDANGAADIAQAHMLINSTSDGNPTTAPVGVFSGYVDNSDGAFYIRNAIDSAWSTAPTNGYFVIFRATSTKSMSGNTLTVNWDLRFNSAWVGENANIYLRTIDSSGLDTGYEDKGDLTIPCPGPVNPSNLTVATSCNGANPEVAFTFTDNSNNEDLFWLDVNGAAWTGATGPSPWGVKTLNRSEAEGDYTGPVTWVWKASDPLSGTPSTPTVNTTYWWRVKAHHSAGDSSHIYPPSSITVPGNSFTTPNCVAAPPAIPTPIGVDNLPTCVNPGLTYGPALNFRWNAVSGATSYTVRLTRNVNTGGDFSLKTVAVTSATGTGGWTNPGPNPLVTWLSGANLAMSPGVTYFFAVSAFGPGGDSSYDLTGKSFQVGPVPECPPSNPSGLSAVAGCDSAGREQITFTFSDTSSNEDLFWLDVNGAAWTGSGAPSPWGVKTINRTGAEKTGVGAVTFVWTSGAVLDSGDVNPTLAGDQRIPAAAGTYWWRVRANNSVVGGSAHVYPANTVTPPGTSIVVPVCVPANPSIPIAPSPACAGSAMEIRFVFRDLSANEDQFILEVNDRPWTGAGPTPFGTKIFNRTPAQRSHASNLVGYVWNAALPMDSGDTNSSIALEQRVPEQSRTYYWRVRARSVVSGDSQNVYYDGASGTTTPPGLPVVTPACSTDFKVEFIEDSWENSAGEDPRTAFKFEPKEKVKVDIKITNNAPNVSPATDLYVYYTIANRPNCPGTAGGTPIDASGVARTFSVPALNGADPLNKTITISNVEVVVAESVGGTIYAYVDPTCRFNAIDWNKNIDSQSYVIASEGFIETQGGGVGAVGDISMAVKSKTTATPSVYQGDYIINANTMNANVDSKNGWIMKNYTAKQVPSGGLYEYFDTKFKGKAASGSCSFTDPAPIRACPAHLTFNSDTAPTGTIVFFVEKDLRIEKNFVLNADSAVLFVVKGNVIVDLGVNRIDGIYIVKGTFKDSNEAEVDAGVADVSGALTVNGALFVENPEDRFLKRYFTTPINRTTPAHKFIWDPKFLLKLSELVGTSSIIWKEVAP